MRGFLIAAVVVTLVACATPTGATGGGGNTSGGAIQGPVEFSVTTASYGGSYSPKNVVALWVETDAGGFVRTLAVWGADRRRNLVSWSSSGANVDGTTGATLSGHGTRTVQWDLRDKSGTSVSSGTYRLWAEMAESNVASGAAAHRVSVDFSFVQGTGVSGSAASLPAGFSSASFRYQP